MSGLRRRLHLTEPVVLDWWHHERWEIPEGDLERIAWLNERWRTLDAWVASIVANRPPLGDGRPEMTDGTRVGNA
ncbi:MAG: hypothetical protein OEV40_04955 [Acidimicrobiia bacterium]|nr:hypothetical protein [Acidimicrobiia bacterium]